MKAPNNIKFENTRPYNDLQNMYYLTVSPAKLYSCVIEIVDSGFFFNSDVAEPL